MREPEATKLFVGQVPRDWTEKQLREILEPFGDIHSLSLITDKATGQHKGCAFLTYYDNESAKAAQEELHEKKTLPGARNAMKIQPAESETSDVNRKLFVGMLSRSIDESDLRDMFSSFGTIEDCTILKNADSTSRGCAFIKYETRLQTQNAIKSMHGSQVMEGNTKSLVVKLADTEKDKLNKKRIQTGAVNTQGPASAVMGAIAPYQQQTAYYQQLLALPQIVAANPSLASAPATPGTIGALVAAMSSQQQQQQQQPLNQQSSHAASQISTTYGGNYNSNYNSASGISSVQPSIGASNLSVLSGYALPQPTGQHQLPQRQTSGPEGANLFVYQIPSEFSDSDLLQTFQPYGNVVSAKVFIDKVTGYSKGFGFVSYDNANSANAAISSMNGAVIGSKRLKVQLKRTKEQGSKPY